MIWLLTLLMSAIIQVFLVHNYAFQMANNAYYSLFKDKAYGKWNKPSEEYQGFPNFDQKKPLRAVSPLEQAGGKVHVTSGGPINWSEDDRAAIPMMPFFQDSIVKELQNRGITRAPVRLKLGTKISGLNYLETKYLRMGMGTEGGFGAFFGMIEALFKMAGQLGVNATDYTNGYDPSDLENEGDKYDQANNDLNNQDPNAAQNARDQWDEAHGDYNHDGYNDVCESMHGNNASICNNHRPWE
jgi:hypothetical protein